MSDPVLEQIGRALFHLRRVWARPDLMRKVREQTPGSRPLQLSNLMVVSAVTRLGEGGGEVTVGAVAERLEIDPSTASRLVGHAIDAGFVSRRPSVADARRANLQLTDAGKRVMESADRHRHAYLQALMADWPEEERNEFCRLLTRFTDAMANDPMDPSRISEIFEDAENAR
ncbi:MarR family winged helix-turn-helix transcriptional regulator [Actinocorallia longicatena]|uniref:MarR family winged helix-turn-helix transcriptional regulator n=1 Tax=Actinocorallia longicatena TaxID=111803 RepID=A0ABP6QDS8_9ACTN